MYSKIQENNWCLYKHTSPSNKVYIGITSQLPKVRWGKNGANYKTNKYFNNAITKYGWDKFKHEIIFSNLSEFDAKELEIEYIAKFNSNNQKYGYNLTIGGEGTKGYVYNSEQRKNRSIQLSGKGNPMYGNKMSLKQKKIISIKSTKYWSNSENRKHQSEAILGEKNGNSVGVKQYTKQGVFLKEYSSACEAEREIGISHSSIIANCRNKHFSAGGYIWRYKNDSFESALNNSKLFIKVNQYDENGNYIATYNSISEAEKLNGICRNCVNEVLRGKQNKAGGYIWKRA